MKTDNNILISRCSYSDSVDISLIEIVYLDVCTDLYGYKCGSVWEIVEMDIERCTL